MLETSYSVKKEDRWTLLMIILCMSCKDISRHQRFYLFTFLVLYFLQANYILPNVPDHFVNNEEMPHCQWGWMGSYPHSYFISADWTSLSFHFFPFLPLKEHACTHTDFILSHYLPAVWLKCQALKCVFSNSSSSNIWIYATLILAGLLLFLFGLQTPVDVLYIHNDIKP